MAGYLEDYGVADEKRSRIVRLIVISVSVVFVVGLAFYLTYPMISGWWHVRAFMADLERRDYQAAYHDWGCTKPCQDYKFEDFLRDWGPKSKFAGAGSVKKAWPCGGGIIVTVAAPDGARERIWYQPADDSLSFWPWEGCPARIPAPTAAP